MDGKEQGRVCVRGLWTEALQVFERQVLVFPLLVVCLACTSFLFGGRCAAWQWWAAVGAVVGVPFLKKGGWRKALGALGLFAGLLVLLKGILPPMLWDNSACVDMNMYHLPMIQLLIEGWNPVTDAFAEGICSSLGLDIWGMAPVHVAFLQKTMAVFAAVSYQFVRDPTGLTIPGLTFLWLGLALQILRLYRGAVRWGALAALIWVLPMVSLRMFVDLSLAFASCGLLFAMADALNRDRFNWLQLGVWSIWLATIKLNGVMAAAVFWGLFASIVLWRKREKWHVWLGRFSVLGLVVASLSAVIAWNPYVTSWKTFGHPVYPFMTADEERFPAQDPTWDMRLANDDYKGLGRAGLWAYHYVSPELVKAAGRWVTGRKDFSPESTLYSDQYISVHVRPWLWALWAVLLILPKGRLWGIGGLLLTFCAPWEKIGYPRYEPWLSALACLALVLLLERFFTRYSRRRGMALAGVLTCLAIASVVPWIVQHARKIDFKAKEFALMRERIHCNFWAPNRGPEDGVTTQDFVPRLAWLTMLENQCRLFVKEMGWESHATVLPAVGWVPDKKYPWQARRPMWEWDERQWFAPASERDERFPEDLGTPWQGWDPWEGLSDPESDVEAWVLTPWRYWVPLDAQAENVVDYFTMTQVHAGESRGEWFGRLLRFTAKTWFVRYPQEVWKWLTRVSIFAPISNFFQGAAVEFPRKFAHPASRKPPKRRVVKTYPLASQKGRARMSPCFCEPSNDTRTESSISTGRWSRTFASAGACSSGRRST